MNKDILNIINEKQLSSIMSNTKWRRLATVLTSNDEFEPKVWLKYLQDKHPNKGYSLLDWEWVKHGESSCIEWMVIDPVKSQHRGQLVKPTLTDYSEYIESCLQKCSIPYSMEEQHYKVWGYIHPGTSPNFVK